MSSVWIGSALEGNGFGTLTSVDILAAHQRRPTARETLERAGLTDRVELNRTSYTWYLQRVLRQQLRDGRIEPVFDFVFLDGAHTWDADGLAFLLVDRLLKPGGWILLDDLAWEARRRALPRRAACSTGAGTHSRGLGPVGAAGFESYDEMSTDGLWGWARKSPTPTPAVRTVVRRDLIGSVRELGGLRDPSSAARQDEAGPRGSRRSIG